MCDTKEIQKVEKKQKKFSQFAYAHTMTDTKNLGEKNSENTSKKKYFFVLKKNGIIHGNAENTKLWLCAAVRLN